jgi:hypothetical protein
LALYDENTTLDPDTLETYTSAGEVNGTGYVAGGNDLPLTIGARLEPDGTVITQFGTISWPGSIFTTLSGLVYNRTNGNRAVQILYFESAQVVTGGRTFNVTFPDSSSNGAVMRSRNA